MYTCSRMTLTSTLHVQSLSFLICVLGSLRSSASGTHLYEIACYSVSLGAFAGS